ncbi:MAG: hypothetical protein J07HQX50_01027 [Haloquadratum sp. J07HQX50]|nr:MAG: hypothetical protein J07HQX50_01027 [Haloquadratum sp. J07HQX50]
MRCAFCLFLAGYRHSSPVLKERPRVGARYSVSSELWCANRFAIRQRRDNCSGSSTRFVPSVSRRVARCFPHLRRVQPRIISLNCQTGRSATLRLRTTQAIRLWSLEALCPLDNLRHRNSKPSTSEGRARSFTALFCSQPS